MQRSRSPALPLLLVLSCCTATCLAADSPFNSTLVAVVVVVVLLLCAISGAAVMLLIFWIRWQRQDEGKDRMRVQLESHRLSPLTDREDEDEKEREDEDEKEREAENHTLHPSVYAQVSKSSPRASSPDNSFISEDGIDTYANVDKFGRLNLDIDMVLRPSRRAPPIPPKKSEPEERQENTGRYEVSASPHAVGGGRAEEGSTVQDATPKRPARRPAPPKPKAWGAEREETEPENNSHFNIPQLRPVPPTKPKEDQPSPLAVQLKPVPPGKSQLQKPPAPPAKVNTPPMRPPMPHTNDRDKPPTLSSKPNTAGPGTKPKPKPVVRPPGVAGASPTHLAPSPAPKPKVKPRISAKPAGGSAVEEGASARVPVAMLGEHVASLHTDNNAGFFQQYDSLPMGEEGHLIIDGILPENACRNRFHNIIPYNDNRPQLQPVPGHREYQHNYVNASYIDGFSHPHKYIAAQGPKSETVVDFWRMVWQEKVPTIAMVTRLREQSSKCQRYWPEVGSIEYGPYRVSLTEQQVLTDYILCTLEVQFISHKKESRKVQHLQFTSWQDNDSPAEAGPLLTYLRRLRSLHRPRIGPLLIHCSAGVGRTGTLLAIDLALEQARREGCVDIPATVTSLRRQRMKMVQCQDQYRFIHDAVLEQLTCGDTQIPTQDFRRSLEKLKQQELKDGAFTTGFAVQFGVLEQVSPRPQDMLCKTAQLYPGKNRNMNYLPPDNNLVNLERETPGYIHASFADGYRQKRVFIIAQAPLEETCRDFWKMVYERECGVIVMLSGLVEDRKLCAQYWAEQRDRQGRRFAEFSTYTTEHQRMSGYTIRKMTITDSRTGRESQVVHFQVTVWSEDDVCSSPSALVEAIHHIQAAQRKSGNKPIVVHGSDTVSRCGMFCALVNSIECCKTEGVVDIFQAVKALRLHKPGSVRTLAHYQSLFHFMTLYLDSFDTYANFK